MECNVVFVRHGQTDWNLTRKIQGQENSQLTELGRAQAEATAEALASESFDVAYSSDLDRAMDTARTILSRHPGLVLHPDPRLREWNLGILQGRTWAELTQDPDFATTRQNIAGGDEKMPCPIPGGESKADLRARTRQFLEFLLEKHAGQSVLVVTHGGVLRQMFRLVVGPIDPQNLPPAPDNASIHRLRREKNGWRLRSWNETWHLRQLPLR